MPSRKPPNPADLHDFVARVAEVNLGYHNLAGLLARFVTEAREMVGYYERPDKASAATGLDERGT